MEANGFIIDEELTFTFDVGGAIPPTPAPERPKAYDTVLKADLAGKTIIGNATHEETIPSYSGGTA